MNNYEVVDLYEVGSAASTILEKLGPDFDEHGDPIGVLDAVEE